MSGLCKDCEYFKIIQEPNKIHSRWYDAGIAYCKKHDIYIPFFAYKKLNDLECIEKEGE